MRIKSKRGLSVVIGYVLLVVAILAMSIIVYSWLKSYVPKDTVECPDGVGVIIRDLECNSGVVNFTVDNSGRFSVAGFFIKATTSSEQEVATLDLSTLCGYDVDNVVLFAGSEENNLGVGVESEEFRCNLDETIYAVEFTPLRYDVQSGRDVTCSKARVREVFDGGCAVV